MTELTISCPKCQTEIPLTETLARPLLDAERAQLNREMQERTAAVGKREQEAAQEQSRLASLQRSLNAQTADVEKAVQQRVAEERGSIAAAEAMKAESQFKAQLDEARRQHQAQTAKIAELQKAELDYRQKNAGLAEEKRQWDLNKARQLEQEREQIRQQAVQAEQERSRIVIAGKEKDLAALSTKLSVAEKAEIEYRQKSAALDEERRQTELTIARRLEEERDQIRQQVATAEQEKNQIALEAKEQELSDLNTKLGLAYKAELELRRERQALQTEKQSLELEVARRLDEERQRVREITQKEDEERHRLHLAEREKVIDDMKRQIEDLRRKSEQGSQQLQGEVQETAIEAILRAAFPRDEIEPVPTGRNGADVLQKVIGPSGLVSGTILWESKRTKSWSDTWLPKVREDQRTAHAHLGVIVSTTLPRNVDTFDRVEDVWVSSFACTIPLAKALRQALIQAALSQLASHDREGKTDRMYTYVTGQEFKQRVSSILEGYTALAADLEREKRSVTTAWARREKFHELVLGGTAGMYGDLHGILGKSMPEVQGLERPQLEAPPPVSEDSPEPPAALTN